MRKKLLLSKNPKVAILMSTFNGGRYLSEQLNSIEAQTHQNWKLTVSDDGSNDDTLTILKYFQCRWGRQKLQIREGACQGFVHNFLSLASDKKIKADLFAFCDQDDIWLPNKLRIGVNYLSRRDQSIPQLYGGRTTIVNEKLSRIDQSPLFVFPCSFRNALVQNFAGGNTILFNLSSKKLIEKAGIKKVPVHDWWVYLLVSASGGHVHYDPNPQILYRQHNQSLIGSNHSFMSKLTRLKYMINGRYKIWNDQNIEALEKVSFLLSKSSKNLLVEFKKLRSGSFLERLMALKKSGVYRQTFLSTFILYLSVLFNKI